MNINRILFITLIGLFLPLMASNAMSEYDGPANAENKIWDGTGSPHSRFSEGTIKGMKRGTISTMEGNAVIHDMAAGNISTMRGSAVIHKMVGGTIDNMEGNAHIVKKISSAGITVMKGNASIGMLKGNGAIATMEGNASIHTMDSSLIGNFKDEATIGSFNGGNISYMSGNALISEMRDGEISTIRENASIQGMHDGKITTMRGNAYIQDMYGGEIHTMRQDARIQAMHGGKINSIQGSGHILGMYGGTIAQMDSGTISTMSGGSITTLSGGTVNFTGQNSRVRILSGATNLGFYVNSPTDYGQLTIDNGGTTDGNHTVSLLMEKATGIRGQSFTLNLIDQSRLASPNQKATYSLEDAPTRFGSYDYDVSDVLENDVYSVVFKGLGMNASDKDSLSSGVGNGMFTGMAQILTANETVGKRLGELRFADLPHEDHINGLWLRQHARRSHVDAFEHTTISSYGLEGGYDRKLSLDAPASVHLGLAAGMNWSKATSSNADTTASSPSLGVYTTALLNNGVYIDTIVRHHWLNLDSDVNIYGSPADSFDKRTNALSFTLETGKQFFWGKADFAYFLQPRIHYSYLHINGYSGTLHDIDINSQEL